MIQTAEFDEENVYGNYVVANLQNIDPFRTPQEIENLLQDQVNQIIPEQCQDRVEFFTVPMVKRWSDELKDYIMEKKVNDDEPTVALAYCWKYKSY